MYNCAAVVIPSRRNFHLLLDQDHPNIVQIMIFVISEIRCLYKSTDSASDLIQNIVVPVLWLRISGSLNCKYMHYSLSDLLVIVIERQLPNLACTAVPFKSSQLSKVYDLPSNFVLL